MGDKKKYDIIGDCEKCGNDKQKLFKHKSGSYYCTACFSEQVSIDRAVKSLPRNERSLTELRKWVKK